MTVTVFPRTSEPIPPSRSKAWRIAAAASAPYERARVSATTPLPVDGGSGGRGGRRGGGRAAAAATARGQGERRSGRESQEAAAAARVQGPLLPRDSSLTRPGSGYRAGIRRPSRK